MKLNKREWQDGDLVIHANDAKEQKMLREVIRIHVSLRTHTRLVDTRFAFPQLLPAKYADMVMTDTMEWLLDPRRFGIPCDVQASSRVHA